MIGRSQVALRCGASRRHDRSRFWPAPFARRRAARCPGECIQRTIDLTAISTGIDWTQVETLHVHWRSVEDDARLGMAVRPAFTGVFEAVATIGD